MSNTPTSYDRTSVTLPRDLARRLSREAEASGRSASAVVREALQHYFAAQEPQPIPPFVGAGDSGKKQTGRRAEEIVSELIEKRHPRRRR